MVMSASESGIVGSIEKLKPMNIPKYATKRTLHTMMFKINSDKKTLAFVCPVMSLLRIVPLLYSRPTEREINTPNDRNTGIMKNHQRLIVNDRTARI